MNCMKNYFHSVTEFMAEIVLTGWKTTFLSDNVYDYYCLWVSERWKEDLNVQWAIVLCDPYSMSHHSK